MSISVEQSELLGTGSGCLLLQFLPIVALIRGRGIPGRGPVEQGAEH